MDPINDNNPKHEDAAIAIAKAFRSKPLAWRVLDGGRILQVVLYSGPKVRGTLDGKPDQNLLRELFPPKPQPVNTIDTSDGVNAQEASTAGSALAKAPRKSKGSAPAKNTARKKKNEPPAEEVPPAVG